MSDEAPSIFDGDGNVPWDPLQLFPPPEPSATSAPAPGSAPAREGDAAVNVCDPAPDVSNLGTTNGVASVSGSARTNEEQGNQGESSFPVTDDRVPGTDGISPSLNGAASGSAPVGGQFQRNDKGTLKQAGGMVGRGGEKEQNPPVGPDGLPKKKKAARARVDDLSPEFIHTCPFDGCPKRFAKKYNLKIHVRRHAGDLPFRCDEPNCDKRFMWQSSFHRHQRSHQRKPKGKRKKMSGDVGMDRMAGNFASEQEAVASAAAEAAAAAAAASVAASARAHNMGMMISQFDRSAMGAPESILSALVGTGANAALGATGALNDAVAPGDSPFDAPNALQSAQLFCTDDTSLLPPGPIFDTSSRHQQDQSRGHEYDRNQLPLGKQFRQQENTQRPHQQEQKLVQQSHQMFKVAPQTSSLRLGSTTAASVSHNQHQTQQQTQGHVQNSLQISPRTFSQMFSPVSDVAAINFLQAGLVTDEVTNTTVTNTTANNDGTSGVPSKLNASNESNNSVSNLNQNSNDQQHQPQQQTVESILQTHSILPPAPGPVPSAPDIEYPDFSDSFSFLLDP